MLKVGFVAAVVLSSAAGCNSRLVVERSLSLPEGTHFSRVFRSNLTAQVPLVENVALGVAIERVMAESPLAADVISELVARDARMDDPTVRWVRLFPRWDEDGQYSVDVGFKVSEGGRSYKWLGYAHRGADGVPVITMSSVSGSRPFETKEPGD